jgi:hypothetical protein
VACRRVQSGAGFVLSALGAVCGLRGRTSVQMGGLDHWHRDNFRLVIHAFDEPQNSVVATRASNAFLEIRDHPFCRELADCSPDIQIHVGHRVKNLNPPLNLMTSALNLSIAGSTASASTRQMNRPWAEPSNEKWAT